MEFPTTRMIRLRKNATIRDIVRETKLEKEDLFGYVQDNGTLCRKSFSMGEADEKRFYLEAKKI